MHPNLFFKTFWTMEFRPQVFVIMSFDPRYKSIFTDVIEPAIGAIRYGNVPIEPHRVDLTKSGDSILTQIEDGIAHSRMILADISSLRPFLSRRSFRNGNVMYELGLALACRQPNEVLLIRDGRDPFLFDVSTIPHMTIDFRNKDVAKTLLHDELVARLRLIDYFNDFRVERTIATITAEEKDILEIFSQYAPTYVFGFQKSDSLNLRAMSAMPRLLDKQILRIFGQADDGKPTYQWTELGYLVMQRVTQSLPKHPWLKSKVVPGATKTENSAQNQPQL